MIDQNYSKHIKNLSPLINEVLKGDTKDSDGLNDFQLTTTQDLVYIPRVGITNFRIPILIKNKEGVIRSHDANASMYVSLEENKNGVSMSRLCWILRDEALEENVDLNFLKKILKEYKEKLQDPGDKEPIDTSFIKLAFQLPVKQKSLKSDNWGWQYYNCTLEAKDSEGSGLEFFASMDYLYSSTCPCSLSMAKQYENEFKENKINEGSGIGVPHSQRSKLTCKVKLDPNTDFYFEDLLMCLKEAIPTETQSLVKRVDEQAFAILNGAHPIFVEHASKRVYKVLNEKKEYLDWIVQLEHLESLHSHNAAAVIFKGVSGGLNYDTIF